MDLEKLKNPTGIPRIPDTLRLVILSVLAIVVIVFFIFFTYQANNSDDEGAIDPQDYVETPMVHQISGAKVDPAKLVEIKDDKTFERVVKEKEPFLHLLQEASRLILPLDMEILGVERAVHAEITANSAACRGKPYEVKGTLQWIEEIEEFDFLYHRGYLTSYEGDHYYFTVLDLLDKVEPGDVVKLQGFFFKQFSFTQPGSGDRINDAVFLIGKTLIPSFYRMNPVDELDITMLDAISDRTITDMAKPFQEKQLYHLLSYVQNLDEKEYEALSFKEIRPKELLNKPLENRGQPVKVLGEIVWGPKRRKLGPQGENPINVSDCYHAIMINYLEGKYGFCYFLALDIPEWLPENKLVYIKGYYLRNYAYMTRNQNVQPAPLVIVRGFEEFIIPEDHTFEHVSYVVLGGAVLTLAFFFLHAFRDRKRNQQYRERFIEKKKSQLKRLQDLGLLDGKKTDAPAAENSAPPEKNPQPPEKT